MPDWVVYTALALTSAGRAAHSASQTRQATKKASSQADTQMRMAQAAQDDIVARDAAAKADVKQARDTATKQAQATVTQKKRAIARSQTIYTSPLGIGGTADVARKTLLGV